MATREEQGERIGIIAAKTAYEILDNPISDISSVYQSLLLQGTGWSVQSVISDMTHARSQEIARDNVDEGNSMTLDNERSL